MSTDRLEHYIDTAQALGLSANRSLTLLRAMGGQVRRADFYQLWRRQADATMPASGRGQAA